jgi:Domain of unknown function (DUF4160)
MTGWGRYDGVGQTIGVCACRPCTLGYIVGCSSHGAVPVILYSADRDEPPHVHVEREEGKAKFWLEPVRLENSRGFGRPEIGRIERLVVGNAAFLLRSWHEYFGD